MITLGARKLTRYRLQRQWSLAEAARQWAAHDVKHRQHIWRIENGLAPAPVALSLWLDDHGIVTARDWLCAAPLPLAADAAEGVAA